MGDEEVQVLMMWLLGPPAVVLACIWLYRRYRFKHHPEFRARLEQRKRAEKEREQREKESRLKLEREHEKWAEAHPRLDSLIRALSWGAFAALTLWAGIYAEKREWMYLVLVVFGWGCAVVAVYYFLAAFFTPSGAATLLMWVIGGGLALWIGSEALETTKGTIILGFVIVIYVIAKGIDEIIKAIRKRDRSES